MRRHADEFERLALPHTGSLLRFAQRMSPDSSGAEDLVQETMMLAWRSFHQLENESHARAWLFRILINTFRMKHRRERPEIELTPELVAPQSLRTESLEVRQALERLAPDHRDVLLLAVVEGFTCREIGEMLSIPMGTVMSRLSRAREAMRGTLASGVAR